MNPLGAQPVVAVIDPRLAAPRGDQFTNAFQESRRRGLDDDEDENWLARPGVGPAEADDWGAEAGTSVPIAQTNIGFRLLQKMGWKEGKGLGKQEDGIVEPIRAGVEAGVRMGLGKQEEDDTHTTGATAARRRLEVEVAATEDEEASRKRGAVAEVLQKRAEDVKEMLQTFFCEVCDKQYSTAKQLEEHLSSYDHQHRKRLAETKAAMAERNRGDRQRREQKVADKEMAKLQKQIETAQQRSRQQQGGGAPNAVAAAAPPLPDESAPPLPDEPPPLPDGPPPPLPGVSGQAAVSAVPPQPEAPGSSGVAAAPEVVVPGTTGISFGLGGSGAGRGGLAGLGGRGGGLARGGLKRPGGTVGLGGRPVKAATAPRPGLAGFGLDSDDEES
ncbi:G patch domain-containing protein 8 [Tetrabaena socialis]|uniref:G patch domain-containing protein 8 n=1 Tax=Tetrabaena socialis TaxID=47790 RepID=A0A2J8A237_9CHLO|nr:G patch domain-containing protein 8 [Tetrabaena socialis]|eukprot:PNH06596.1 G patch domain-containing protein 8 [Tetrabaena socialis]